MNPLKGKRILLGVSGSIAAYKAVELASALTQAGVLVDAVLTQAATRFVTALTFQSLTGRQAYTDADLWGAQAHVLHVSLAKEADLLVIAPATAQTLAKLAQGMADDLLALSALSARCPIILAPAMETGMLENSAVKENLDKLAQRGALMIGPFEGRLASGGLGRGRMAEPSQILGEVRYRLSRSGILSGKKIVVSAGGTQEPLDPVRHLGNRSSGKQGFALAQAALDAGADVTLVAGPVSLNTPFGATRQSVGSAQEMADALFEACSNADALIMAAAVADFKPSKPSSRKIKKQTGPKTLDLEPTLDILAELSRQRKAPPIIIGFAAETENLIAHAKSKLKAKNLDMIVANNVTEPGAGFDSQTNRVTLLVPGAEAQTLSLMSKAAIAEKIIERLAGFLSHEPGRKNQQQKQGAGQS